MVILDSCGRPIPEENLPAGVPWIGPLLPLGVESRDGRSVKALDPLPHRPLPLPLRSCWPPPYLSSHEGAVVVGRIDQLWTEQSVIMGRGVIVPDPDNEMAIELANRLLGDQWLAIGADLDVRGGRLAGAGNTYQATEWIFAGATIVGESAFIAARIWHAERIGYATAI